MLPNLGDITLLTLVCVTFIAIGGLGYLCAPTAKGGFISRVFSGWGALMGVVVLGGTLTHIPLWAFALPLLALGLGVSCYTIIKHKLWQGTLPLALLCFAPLLLLISGMAATQWDDLAHWLPSAQYLFMFDHFPHSTLPASKSGWPAYPYAVPFISYLVSLLQNTMADNVMPLWSTLTLMGLAFGMAGSSKSKSLSTAVAVAALGLMLVWPNFVPKIVFTSYADLPLAVTVCLLALGLLRFKDGGQKAELITIALLAVLAVSIKQVGLVLLALTVGAACLTALITNGRKAIPFCAQSLGATFPALGLYVLWGWYTGQHIPSGEFAFKALADWQWHIWPEMLSNTLNVMFSKSGYFALMFAITARAAYGIWQKDTSPLQHLFMVSSLVFWGYNGFLYVCYLGAFSAYEGARVASLWRYNMHVGLLGFWVAALYIIDRKPWQHLSPQSARVAGYVCILLVCLAPALLAKHLRFDNAPVNGFVQTLTTAVQTHTPQGQPLVVIEPQTKGMLSIALRYHLAFEGNLPAYLTWYDKPITEERIKAFATQHNAAAVLVIFPTNDLSLNGQNISPEAATLFIKSQKGWDAVYSTPAPKGLNMAKL